MKTFRDLIKKKCPNAQALIDDRKLEPTETERIEALENAVAELAIQVMGADTNG